MLGLVEEIIFGLLLMFDRLFVLWFMGGILLRLHLTSRLYGHLCEPPLRSLLRAGDHRGVVAVELLCLRVFLKVIAKVFGKGVRTTGRKGVRSIHLYINR